MGQTRGFDPMAKFMVEQAGKDPLEGTMTGHMLAYAQENALTPPDAAPRPSARVEGPSELGMVESMMLAAERNSASVTPEPPAADEEHPDKWRPDDAPVRPESARDRVNAVYDEWLEKGY